MAEFWGVLGLLSILLLLSLASIRVGRKRRRRKMLESWGKPPSGEPVDGDELEDIKRFWLAMRGGETSEDSPRAAFVDDITWNDLDMDKVFQFLDRTQSNIGQEVLYAMLRDIGASDETLSRRACWMKALASDPIGRLAVQERLGRLGKGRYHGAQRYLFCPSQQPANSWLYFLLAFIPVVCIVLGFFLPLFFLGVALSFVINMVVFYLTHVTWGTALAAIRQIGKALYRANQVKGILPLGMEDAAEELKSLCAKLRPIARWNSLLAMEGAGDLKIIAYYLRITFQLDMISVSRLAAFIGRNRLDVSRLYTLIGEVDACQAVASVRASLRGFIQPEFRDELRVNAIALTHPLVPVPVENTMDWRQNALITGSNASGKSTFIKAMAVNAIFAQSIYTCWAEEFSMPRARVMTSMALRDNLEGGESYFVIEIKSLRRILSSLKGCGPILCFVDEILRGTNTVERIAASCALLHYLNGQDILCLAATHDQELTQLLSTYRQYHFREEITTQGMGFPYRLLDGPSDTRNAIRLLEQMAFPQKVIQDANQMATHFDESGKWLRDPAKERNDSDDAEE